MLLPLLKIPWIPCVFHTSVPLHILFHLLGRFCPFLSTWLTSQSLILYLNTIPFAFWDCRYNWSLISPLSFYILNLLYNLPQSIQLKYLHVCLFLNFGRYLSQKPFLAPPGIPSPGTWIESVSKIHVRWMNDGTLSYLPWPCNFQRSALGPGG